MSGERRTGWEEADKWFARPDAEGGDAPAPEPEQVGEPHSRQ